jgi:plasmid stabilization system protein ParE
MEELEAQIRYLRQKENVTAEDQQMIENLRKQKRMLVDQVYIIRMSADNIRQKLRRVRQDQKLYHGAVINARKSLSHFIAILNDDGDGGHNAAAVSAMVEKDNGSSGFNIDSVRSLLKTAPNTAYFWSGSTDGVGGADVAAEIAKDGGGVTLETTVQDNNVSIPEWDFDNPESMEAWSQASEAYADQVSGEVHAVVGANQRPDSIWSTVELPKLKNNQNVSKITTIDPKTKKESVIFKR